MLAWEFPPKMSVIVHLMALRGKVSPMPPSWFGPTFHNQFGCFLVRLSRKMRDDHTSGKNEPIVTERGSPFRAP